MNWYKNLKIGAKLILGFGIVIVFTAFLGLFAIYELSNLDESYDNLLNYPTTRMETALEARYELGNMRFFLRQAALFSEDLQVVETQATNMASAYGRALTWLDEYEKALVNDPSLSVDVIRGRQQDLREIRSNLETYINEFVSVIFDAARQGDQDYAKTYIGGAAAVFNLAYNSVNDMADSAKALMIEASADATSNAQAAITITVVVVIAVILIAMVLALAIASIIKKPIIELVDVAHQVAKGNMNVNLRADTKDEIGILGRSFGEVIENVRTLVEDTEDMYQQHESQGDMDARIDASKFQGEYKNMANGVNQMVEAYVEMVHDILNVVGVIGQGDFVTKTKQYTGKKAEVNAKMGNMRSQILAVANEIEGLAKAGIAGNLSKRADASNYKGQWLDIINGLNGLMEAVVTPINEAIDVMVKMSHGDFATTMTGNYQGDFLTIKEALNTTEESIESYINELNSILSQMSQGDLRGGITRQYLGEFSSIKDSINTILDSLNRTMTEINISSEQVLMGAKQISESSMSLAQGATEQASSVQQLNASIDTINEQVHTNAESANHANKLSLTSTDNAKTGNEEMKKMLNSMDGIKESSNNISKIIKVIEDIAFQTNLLALNAAVQAARAGEHGKGFAVVAEEVRNLAGRSQTAAKETTELIEGSIGKVDEGTSIAHTTAEALDMIVKNADEVSKIIADISEASTNQAEAIGQVGIGVNQISQVIQNNSSTSEEAAAAAQQLNSQAELLRQMVSFFKTR